VTLSIQKLFHSLGRKLMAAAALILTTQVLLPVGEPAQAQAPASAAAAAAPSAASYPARVDEFATCTATIGTVWSPWCPTS
jgi:hypothetical protein